MEWDQKTQELTRTLLLPGRWGCKSKPSEVKRGSYHYREGEQMAWCGLTAPQRVERPGQILTPHSETTISATKAMGAESGGLRGNAGPSGRAVPWPGHTHVSMTPPDVWSTCTVNNTGLGSFWIWQVGHGCSWWRLVCTDRKCSWAWWQGKVAQLHQGAWRVACGQAEEERETAHEKIWNNIWPGHLPRGQDTKERKKEVAKSYGSVWGLGIACLPPETRKKFRKLKHEDASHRHISVSGWRTGERGLVIRLKAQINLSVKTLASKPPPTMCVELAGNACWKEYELTAFWDLLI